MTARRFPTTVVALVLGLFTVVSAVPAQALAPGASPVARASQTSAQPSGKRLGGEALAKDLDKKVRQQLEEYQLPGASMALVSGGREVLTRGYGDARVEGGLKADGARTPFFMASMAKFFTSIAAMQMVEQGKLKLDTDVNHYLKSFKIDDTYPDQPVTLHHLLTHSGGFDDSIVGRAEAKARDAESLEEGVKDQPERVRPPGEAVSYDNYGFALAGYLVEVAAKQPFAEYVQQHVLKPLGMRHTTFTQPHPTSLDKHVARGYRPDGDGQTRAYGQYGAWSPSGPAAITTAADMSRLLRAFLNGGQLDGHRVLRPSSVKAMEKRHRGNSPGLPGVGYSLEERESGGHRMLIKDGDVTGFHGIIALLPERDTALFVVYNGDGKDGAGSWAGHELSQRMRDRVEGTSSHSSVTRSKVTEDAGRYEGEYRELRTSKADITRAGALMSAVKVTAGPDGTISTSGPLNADPDGTERDWVQIKPGVFQEKGGYDRLVFDGDRMSVASAPTSAYERLPWYQSPQLHTMVLGIGLVLLLLSLVGWSIAALVRRYRHTGNTGGPRLALLMAWCTAGLLVGAAACFAKLASDSNALNQTMLLDDSLLLRMVPWLISLALATSMAMLICVFLSWRAKWWGWTARFHYSATTLVALVTVWLSAAYNLVGR